MDGSEVPDHACYWQQVALPVCLPDAQEPGAQRPDRHVLRLALALLSRQQLHHQLPHARTLLPGRWRQVWSHSRSPGGAISARNLAHCKQKSHLHLLQCCRRVWSPKWLVHAGISENCPRNRQTSRPGAWRHRWRQYDVRGARDSDVRSWRKQERDKPRVSEWWLSFDTALSSRAWYQEKLPAPKGCSQWRYCSDRDVCLGIAAQCLVERKTYHRSLWTCCPTSIKCFQQWTQFVGILIACFHFAFIGNGCILTWD